MFVLSLIIFFAIFFSPFHWLTLILTPFSLQLPFFSLGVHFSTFLFFLSYICSSFDDVYYYAWTSVCVCFLLSSLLWHCHFHHFYLIFSLVYPVWAKIIFYFLLNFFSDGEPKRVEWRMMGRAWKKPTTFFIQVKQTAAASAAKTTYWWLQDKWDRVKVKRTNRMILFIYYF